MVEADGWWMMEERPRLALFEASWWGVGSTKLGFGLGGIGGGAAVFFSFGFLWFSLGFLLFSFVFFCFLRVFLQFQTEEN